MTNAARLILVLAAALLGAKCHAGIRAVEEVTSTSARLVMKARPDCDFAGYMHFEYAESRAGVEAGKGLKTREVHFEHKANGCAGHSATFDRDVAGLAPDTTYYYRVCRSEAGDSGDTCTTSSQFTTREPAGSMGRVTARDGDLFRNGERFRVLGVQNLGHDFERDFYINGSAESRAEMSDRVKAARTLGANTMRIHLQLFDFIGRDDNGKLFARQDSFDNLAFLQTVAEGEGLYLLVSGNNAWFPDEVPAWYDEMSYRDRWEVQAFFFEHVAATGATSPSILAYELMSEPTLRMDEDADWYYGEFGGYWFVQSIARGVPRDEAHQVVRDWIIRLSKAIREQDADHLITFGALVAHHGGGLGIDNTAPLLDILSPHIYPRADDPASATEMVKRFANSGKPVVVGETHLFQSNREIYRQFLITSAPTVDGYISFFDGMAPEDMVIERDDPGAIVLELHKSNLQELRSLREVILGR